MPTLAKIFICYRRQDTAGHARHLYAALSARFGVEAVFFDHELDPGADFAARGLQALACSQIVLVLIGPRWAQLLGADGRRRLEDPADLVRMEIERALERPGLEIVPVLVEQATMPLSTELPPSIAGLARRNAAALNDARWDHDLARLTETVERALGCSHRRGRGFVAIRGRPGRVALSGAVIALTTVVFMFAFVFDHEAGQPYSAERVCGAGYKQIDRVSLGPAGKTYLLYNAGNGNNCVVTLKATAIKTRTKVGAYLRVARSDRGERRLRAVQVLRGAGSRTGRRQVREMGRLARRRTARHALRALRWPRPDPGSARARSIERSADERHPRPATTVRAPSETDWR